MLQLFDAPSIVDHLRQAAALDGAAAVAGAAQLRLRPRPGARPSPRGWRARPATDDGERLDAGVSPRLRPRRRTTDERGRLRDVPGDAARRSTPSEKDADDRAWADLCQMLLASNAFLYVE